MSNLSKFFGIKNAINTYPKTAIFSLIFSMCLLLKFSDKYFLQNNNTFCISQIISDENSAVTWDEKSYSYLNQENDNHILHQKFTYFARGDQSIAFISEDEKAILKFYRQKSDSTKCKLSKIKKSLEYAFTSLGNDSCLLAVHLNKSKNCPYEVELIDPSGFSYRILLKETKFILQKNTLSFISFLEDQLINKISVKNQKKISCNFDCLRKVDIKEQTSKEFFPHTKFLMTNDENLIFKKINCDSKNLLKINPKNNVNLHLKDLESFIPFELKLYFYEVSEFI